MAETGFSMKERRTDAIVSIVNGEYANISFYSFFSDVYVVMLFECIILEMHRVCSL